MKTSSAKVTRPALAQGIAGYESPHCRDCAIASNPKTVSFYARIYEKGAITTPYPECPFAMHAMEHNSSHDDAESFVKSSWQQDANASADFFNDDF